MIHRDHTVKIPYLLSEHGGKYACEIQTLLDSVRMETEVVVRTLSPTVQFVSDDNLGEMVGGKIDLECRALGIPPPRIIFKHRQHEYVGQVLLKTENSTVSILHLDNLSAAQRGRYTCLAVNEYGNHDGSLNLEVYSRTNILAGPTDTILKSGQSAFIPCQVSFNKFFTVQRPMQCCKWDIKKTGGKVNMGFFVFVIAFIKNHQTYPTSFYLLISTYLFFQDKGISKVPNFKG